MKAAVFMEPGKMEVHEVEKPTIQKPTDAILKIVRVSVDQIYGGIVELPIVNTVHLLDMRRLELWKKLDMMLKMSNQAIL